MMDEIQEALNPVVDDFQYPVAWPDIDAENLKQLKNDKEICTLLKVNYLFGRAEGDGLKGSRQPGILQVTLMTRDDQGTIKPSKIAQTIMTKFKRGSEFSYNETEVTIFDPPYPRIGGSDKGWHRIFISIPFEVFSCE